MKTAGEMSRMNLVIQSPTSVEPATIVAFGSLLEHRGEVVDASAARSPGRRRSRMSTRAPSSSAVEARAGPRARSATSGSASGEAVAGAPWRRR